MRKKILIGLLVAAVATTAYCFHRRIFQDDEKRIREILEDMRVGAEEKNAGRIIEHFSSDFEAGGMNKFTSFHLIRRTLEKADEIRIEFKDVSVLVAGDRAYVTLEATSEATVGGKITFPFGSDQNPETPRMEFVRTTTGDWKLISVDDVDSRGL